jgi:hypothetical protein
VPLIEADNRRMRNTLALVASGLVIAIASAAIGVAVSVSYIAQPLQKGQSEFTEAYLVEQIQALQALRSGNTQPALSYLERVSALSLVSLGAARDGGANVPGTSEARQAVDYACSQPPGAAASLRAGKLSVPEACYLLRKP